MVGLADRDTTSDGGRSTDDDAFDAAATDGRHVRRTTAAETEASTADSSCSLRGDG